MTLTSAACSGTHAVKLLDRAQGGIHPDFDGKTYLAILAAAKAGAPDIHVHAFSPLEVQQGAATLGWPLPRCRPMLCIQSVRPSPGPFNRRRACMQRCRLVPDIACRIRQVGGCSSPASQNTAL